MPNEPEQSTAAGRSGLPMRPAPRPGRAQAVTPSEPEGEAIQDHVPPTTRTACSMHAGTRMPNEPKHRERPGVRDRVPPIARTAVHVRRTVMPNEPKHRVARGQSVITVCRSPEPPGRNAKRSRATGAMVLRCTNLHHAPCGVETERTRGGSQYQWFSEKGSRNRTRAGSSRPDRPAPSRYRYGSGAGRVERRRGPLPETRESFRGILRADA
jgi:hypothetical protein